MRNIEVNTKENISTSDIIPVERERLDELMNAARELTYADGKEEATFGDAIKSFAAVAETEQELCALILSFSYYQGYNNAKHDIHSVHTIGIHVLRD